jgi:hypothetical protein
MEMTGWLSGQVFLQTVDEREVAEVTSFLESHGISFQLLTLSEQMVITEGDGTGAVSTDRFSLAVQIGGFPQVIGPVLTDLVRRAHGGGWGPEPVEG